MCLQIDATSICHLHHTKRLCLPAGRVHRSYARNADQRVTLLSYTAAVMTWTAAQNAIVRDRVVREWDLERDCRVVGWIGRDVARSYCVDCYNEAIGSAEYPCFIVAGICGRGVGQDLHEGANNIIVTTTVLAVLRVNTIGRIYIVRGIVLYSTQETDWNASQTWAGGRATCVSSHPSRERLHLRDAGTTAYKLSPGSTRQLLALRLQSQRLTPERAIVRLNVSQDDIGSKQLQETAYGTIQSQYLLLPSMPCRHITTTMGNRSSSRQWKSESETFVRVFTDALRAVEQTSIPDSPARDCGERFTGEVFPTHVVAHHCRVVTWTPKNKTACIPACRKRRQLARPNAVAGGSGMRRVSGISWGHFPIKETKELSSYHRLCAPLNSIDRPEGAITLQYGIPGPSDRRPICRSDPRLWSIHCGPLARSTRSIWLQRNHNTPPSNS
ncbi:hypothetical protein M8818_004430 [Zalaria obscura]|uniref:Uncharacterized protein n=1 Tax=Zalaria obscura TaxID=2024903 RepID=A0ACC3SBZ1_9PEZI